MTNLLGLLWRPLLMLAGLVGAGMVLRSTGFDPRQAVATAGEHGPPAFLLIGTLVLLPVILMYTAWSYWVFRGKVRGDIGYH